MTPEAQRIAIAEACGWKSPLHPDCMKLKEGWSMPEKWWLDPAGKMQLGAHSLPDYLNDLNAMHEAEKVLFDTYDRSKWMRYVGELQNACCCGGNATHNDHIHAAAAQRAEAFLRTIGKWQDSTEQKAHKCTQ